MGYKGRRAVQVEIMLEPSSLGYSFSFWLVPW